MRIRQFAKSAALLTVATMLLVGCSLDDFKSKNGKWSDVQDRQQGLTRQDYRDMNKASKLLPDGATASASAGAPAIPDLAQVLAAPRPPKVANAKLVTLSVTEDVPLRDVLFELGRLAGVDIEVGSGLDQQGINLRATDRPFNEVIERISDLASLRYSVKGNSMRVERDLPYIKNYNLDFINIVRSSQSTYSLNTSVLSAGSGSGQSGGGSGGGGGSSSSSSSNSGSGSSGGNTRGSVGTSGSSTSINSEAESDLWASMEASIGEILNYFPQGGSDAMGGAAPAAPVAAPAGAPAGAAAITQGRAGFVINRQAGILSANATERQHEMIQRFITLMARNASAQVLIEAKIVEVSLRDRFLSGVDWNSIIGSLGGVYAAPGTYAPIGGTDFSFTNNGATVFGVNEGDLNAVVSLTERFGTTRTLSSPRLNAINNQQAVLTFARNEVFFDCTVEPATTAVGTGTVQTDAAPNCTANSVPIGIILNILPSINLDNQEVTLSVRPTLTRKVGDATNPVSNYVNRLGLEDGEDSESNIPVLVPIIEVREIDSIMKVKSGGIMVIGGLMEDASTTENRGVPGMSDLPLIGSAFKSRDEDYTKRELIIFIKATIVNPDGSSHKVDRAVIDRFSTDPRPLFPKKEDVE